MSFISCLWKKLKLLIRNHDAGNAPLPGRAPMVPWGALASYLFGLAPARRLPALLQMGTGGLQGNVTAASPSRITVSPSRVAPHGRHRHLQLGMLRCAAEQPGLAELWWRGCEGQGGDLVAMHPHHAIPGCPAPAGALPGLSMVERWLFLSISHRLGRQWSHVTILCQKPSNTRACSQVSGLQLNQLCPWPPTPPFPPPASPSPCPPALPTVLCPPSCPSWLCRDPAGAGSVARSTSKALHLLTQLP